MVTLGNSGFFQELSDIQNMKVENRNCLFILFQLWLLKTILNKEILLNIILCFSKNSQKLATKYNH
jgi:hypothetical protein